MTPQDIKLIDKLLEKRFKNIIHKNDLKDLATKNGLKQFASKIDLDKAVKMMKLNLDEAILTHYEKKLRN